jgi:hypothetical protein
MYVCPSSRIVICKLAISETGSVSTGEGRETPTVLDPIERAKLNHWKPTSYNNSAIST